jgi:hypothetical protein
VSRTLAHNPNRPAGAPLSTQQFTDQRPFNDVSPEVQKQAVTEAARKGLNWPQYDPSAR